MPYMTLFFYRTALFILVCHFAFDIALAQEIIPTEVTLPIQLNITSYADSYKFLRTTSQPNGQMSETYLRFLEPKTAKITRLGPRRLRFEVSMPYKFSVFPSEAPNSLADRAFRSFVVDTTPEYADTIMQLSIGRYLKIDNFSPDQLLEFLEETKLYGHDHFIQEFNRGRSAPRIYEFLSLSFFLHYEELGTYEGALVDHFNITVEDFSSPHGLNREPKHLIKQGTIDQIQKIVTTEEAPIIMDYLNELSQIRARQEELYQRGWLNVLHHAATAEKNRQVSWSKILTQQASVIAFPAMNCRNFFK